MSKNMNSSSGHIVATAVEAIPIQGVNTTPLNYAYNSNNNNQQNQAISSSVPVQPVSNVNEGGAREFLTANKWPVGLQDCLLDHLNRIPIRFFICDDSGSMIENDGHKLVTSANGQNRLIPCSRWSELTESLKFHASLSNAACIPSEFRLLNGAEPILVGTDQDSFRFQTLMTLFDGSPNGGTPLCRHIREVTATIRSMEPQLRAANQKACVIIATDGESSDGDLATAMRPLKDLPVWVVVRLCTDSERIVNYWNNIDNELELEMDVLDDLAGEAEEVFEANRWLTYGEPLHRLREFGISLKELDLLDESLLSLEQMRKVCALILGGKESSYPHPAVDWRDFIAEINRRNRTLPMVWSVKHNRAREWINVTHLGSAYRKGSCTIL